MCSFFWHWRILLHYSGLVMILASSVRFVVNFQCYGADSFPGPLPAGLKPSVKRFCMGSLILWDTTTASHKAPLVLVFVCVCL